MRVVFLDFDGVINTIQIYKEQSERNDRISAKGYFFDMCNSSKKRVSNMQAVIWLDKICHDYDLKIVISSTWRINYKDSVEALYNSGLSKDIDVVGYTPWDNDSRGSQIKKYLSEHKEIKDFIILDDDSDMDDLINHLIQTNTYAGITAETEMKVGAYFNDKR